MANHLARENLLVEIQIVATIQVDLAFMPQGLSHPLKWNKAAAVKQI